MHSNVTKTKKQKPTIEERSKKWNKQKSGNVGLYYVAYELERRGWNVLITSRNAKGPDMIVYSQSGKKVWTIQVKSSRIKKDRPRNLGKSMVNFQMSEFVVLCTGVQTDSPDLFIAKTTKLWKLGKNTEGGHYVNPSDYSRFKDRFESLGNPYDT